MMGTRCGTLDPGVVLHLQTQLGMGADEVDDLLYRKSGLLGVSGISSDMRALTADPGTQAQEAVELFVWSAAREFGALAASLGGVEGIGFRSEEQTSELQSLMRHQITVFCLKKK